MSLTNDGGPAFAGPEFDGMSLRDYFAAAALPEALKQEATSDSGGPCVYDETAVARLAYRLADAMLEARRK